MECTYCGHKWIEQVYNQSAVQGTQCVRCKDRYIKMRDLSSKINYYQGCPDFPSKLIRNDDWPYLLMGGD